jgi:L-amino acid ligase C-terminal domain 2
VLEFGAGISLEELILRHAFGEPVTSQRATGAVGAMMIPVPTEGILRRWEGTAEAQAVPGIAGIDITAKIGLPIRKLPAGESYLGFIFATGDSPEFVESALRRAHSYLRFDFAPMLHLRAN